MRQYKFLDENGSFQLDNAENDLGLYFPIAGENGLKSAITPNLAGDSKLDQNHFLLEPASIENLNNNRSTRNFWVITNKGTWSATGVSAAQEAERYTEDQDQSYVKAGLMWHEIGRTSEKLGLSSKITSFVPIQRNVEIMVVTIENTGDEVVEMTALAAIPVYGRSADNLRDHRHVTSLLHRTSVSDYGIQVSPTLSFDERGHQLADTTYFVEAKEGDGNKPVAIYPELAKYLGQAGTFLRPAVVAEIEKQMKNPEAKAEIDGCLKTSETVDGQEVIGAIQFAPVTLKPRERKKYLVFIGATMTKDSIVDLHRSYPSTSDVDYELEVTKQYWLNKINVHYQSGDKNFDQYMNWVSFQPELRRIYGCSFLPHHDYGKGGRGWRDLWQDCLALLVMNPQGVRQMLLSNFAGVRVDGTNATIIGEKQGEFKADRNSITRVWMDHGVWPFITTKLYVDQTGDMDILYQPVCYFKDRQVARGTAIDEKWDKGSGWQLDKRDFLYQGTVLEHLLVQAITAFFEVGEHNEIRLRDADWNDALDMAGENGESVAFTNAYAMNLLNLANLIREEAERGKTEVEVLAELEELLFADAECFDSIEKKTYLLNKYTTKVKYSVSGTQVKLDAKLLADALEEKAQWMMNHIRENEWVCDTEGNGWFNGYYDNNKNRVEGVKENGQVNMMLTSQVFSVMAGTASEEQVASIAKACDKYLYDEACGGYRLNTDFHELKTDMGRMFGFAFGEKENGAVFSHMAVMYANAMYQRGFVKEGYKSLHALYAQAMNFEKSRIFPGVPEYFGKDGRGLYHYLTGAASWYMLTVIHEMYGTRGERGALVVEPKLLLEQFDEAGEAGISLKFADISWNVKIANPDKLEYGSYAIAEVSLDGTVLENKNIEENGKKFKLSKEEIKDLDARKQHQILVTLGGHHE